MTRHGGRRQGAGRAPKLQEVSRLAIGALCDKMQTDERVRQTREGAVEAALRNTDIQGSWVEINHVPKEFRSDVLKYAEGNSVRPDDLPAVVQNAIDELVYVREALDGDARASRYLEARRLARGKLTRSQICQDVAAQESKARNMTIQPWYVDQCWKEYSAIAARLDEDEDYMPGG